VVGSAVLIHGRPGVGKSRTTYRLASPRRCLVVHPELSREIAAAIVRATGADPRRVYLWPKLDDWQSRARERRARSVVLDSLSASPDPVSELQSARLWAQQSRAVVWCIAHTTKSGKHAGASALAFWADYELRLRRERAGEVALDVLKQRLGPEGTVSLPLAPESPHPHS